MIKKWNETLEKIFESNNQDLNLIESSQNFELNPDNSYLENLSYVYNNTVEKNNLPSLFSQLSPYFEIGFLLEKQDRSHTTTHMFAYGNLIDLKKKSTTLSLPNSTVFTVLKTSAPAILKKMNMNFLNPQNKLNAFVISVSPQYSFLVFTKLADPWLKLRLESLQSTLMKIYFE